MAKVECTAGRPVETTVMGETYKFTRDRFGRFVADVHIDGHVAILTSVVHYRVVEDEPAQAPSDAPALQPKSDTTNKPRRGGRPKKTDTGKSMALTSSLASDQPNPGQDGKEADAGGRPNQAGDGSQPGLGDGGGPDDDAGKSENDAGGSGADDGVDSGDGRDEGAQDQPDPDELPSITDIDGIGPAVQKKLASAGITTLAQIAALDDEAIAKLDADLKLKGSITRLDWVEQAKALMPDQE